MNGNYNMSERNTYITQYSRICQVALQTRYRQFHSQMFQNCSSYTQVTFRIFKVNRIHLVRHSTGTHFTGFDLLLEIFHGNILPEVTVHIDHHCINAFHCIKDSGKIIIIGDLRSILFAFQSQLFSYEFVTECFPVKLRISNMMCVVISGSTAKLSSNGTSL